MPKTESESPALALTQDQFAQLLDSIRSSSNSAQTDRLEQILLSTAKVSAETMKKALKPENDFHPGKSVYSYPEGDVEHPRPALPFQLFWQGFPVHKFPEQHHWYELELLAQLQPGVFQVSLPNSEGAQKVEVFADRDAANQITKLEVRAEGMSRDIARSCPPMAVWAYQMLHPDQPLSESYINGMTAFMRHVVQQKPPVPEGQA